MACTPASDGRGHPPVQRGRRPSVGVVAFVVAVFAAGLAFGAGSSATTASTLSGSTCLAGAAPSDLDRLFAAEPGGVIGADYQRATSLPDGRVLWTFQDAKVRLPNGGVRLVHNIGMVQDGACFQVLIGGTAEDPRPWLFADQTVPFARWYWPLGAELGAERPTARVRRRDGRTRFELPHPDRTDRNRRSPWSTSRRSP